MHSYTLPCSAFIKETSEIFYIEASAYTKLFLFTSANR